MTADRTASNPFFAKLVSVPDSGSTPMTRRRLSIVVLGTTPDISWTRFISPVQSFWSSVLEWWEMYAGHSWGIRREIEGAEKEEGRGGGYGGSVCRRSSLEGKTESRLTRHGGNLSRRIRSSMQSLSSL